MKLSESVKSISYLKSNAAEIINEIGENKRSYVITQNGDAKAVLLDIESYEEIKDTLVLLKMLTQSSKSKHEGDYKSATQATKDLRNRIKKLNEA
ncbi:MAG: type II toxin-antitoxin system Phd/YefM family antitoxin [Lentisphaeria bacterium]|nr:type II toxin-antitoxin system Phd/YefM family antitoxin [Lentisphaeria bacterium]NQZ68936.1 type II toxin-antitoxin system Phd/YefM family antitoxin [Lentisphaeria bacterium]